MEGMRVGREGKGWEGVERWSVVVMMVMMVMVRGKTVLRELSLLLTILRND